MEMKGFNTILQQTEEIPSKQVDPEVNWKVDKLWASKGSDQLEATNQNPYPLYCVPHVNTG